LRSTRLQMALPSMILTWLVSRANQDSSFHLWLSQDTQGSLEAKSKPLIWTLVNREQLLYHLFLWCLKKNQMKVLPCSVLTFKRLSSPGSW
jgi:hypothetical protein